MDVKIAKCQELSKILQHAASPLVYQVGQLYLRFEVVEYYLKVAENASRVLTWALVFLRFSILCFTLPKDIFLAHYSLTVKMKSFRHIFVMPSLCVISTLLATAHNNILERQGTSTTTSVFSLAAYTLPIPSAVPNVNGTEHDLSQHYCGIYRHSSMFSFPLSLSLSHSWLL